MHRHDRMTSALGLLTGLGMMAWSLATLGLGELQHPGPGFLPFLSGLLMAGLALSTLVKSLRRERPADAAAFVPPGALPRLAVTLGALVLYAVLLERAGFLATTFLVMLAIFTLTARTSWAVGLAESAVVTGAFWWLFARVLKIPLPKGWLGF